MSSIEIMNIYLTGMMFEIIVPVAFHTGDGLYP